MATIQYKGGLISTSSKAYELFKDKNFKELDKHLKEVRDTEKKMMSHGDHLLNPITVTYIPADNEEVESAVIYSPYMIHNVSFIKRNKEDWFSIYPLVTLTVSKTEDSVVYLSLKGVFFQTDDDPGSVVITPIATLSWDRAPNALYYQFGVCIPFGD